MALFVLSKIGKFCHMMAPELGLVRPISDKGLFSVTEEDKMDPCLMHPELEAESIHLCSQMKYSVSNCRKFI